MIRNAYTCIHMSGHTAEDQFERVKSMVKQACPECKVVWHPGELDSLHLWIENPEGQHSKPLAWVGAHIASLSDDALWHKLEVETQGFVRKPA